MTATSRILRTELSVPSAVPSTNPTVDIFRTELQVPDVGANPTVRVMSTTLSVPDATQLPVIRDGFNRSNASALGLTETGETWQVSGGTFGIVSLKAKVLS